MVGCPIVLRGEHEQRLALRQVNLVQTENGSFEAATARSWEVIVRACVPRVDFVLM